MVHLVAEKVYYLVVFYIIEEFQVGNVGWNLLCYYFCVWNVENLTTFVLTLRIDEHKVIFVKPLHEFDLVH